MKKWLHSSFRNQIFAALLLTALAPLLLGGALMLHLQVERIESSLAHQAELQLNSLERCFDGVYNSCTQMAEELAQSTVVHSALHRGGGDSRTLYQVLYRVTEPLRNNACFNVYDGEGFCRYTTGTSLPSAPLDTEWGLLSAARNGSGLIFRSETGGGLSAARAIRGHNQELLGYLTISFQQNDFVHLFGNLYDPTSEVLFMDNQWRPIYYSRPAQAEDTVRALRTQLLEGKPLTGADGEYHFFPRRSGLTGFTLILQQPKPFNSRVMNTIYTVSVFVGTLCVLLCLLCTVSLSRYLSRPVYQLDQAMGLVERGKFDVHLKTDRSDELGRLANSFNRMSEEYLSNLERSIRRQQELNDTRLRMMQAQLNPHFLYNTLDTVKWLGVVHHVPEAADLATNLAAILRSAISEDKLVTLDMELDLVERYAEIQSIRFQDRFTCEIDVAERYRNCLVPKLALQPLVENAILHGVVDLDEGYVKVWAQDEDGDLILNVSDNGPGIPAEILEQLNRPDKQIAEGHLGLFNVDRIIRLHYGQQYGLSAVSAPETGALVQLRLPMRRKEEPYAESPDR